ncbi:MAG: orotate phosphoribosyltransferase [Candidatus Izemoplasmatales bacterium]|nr:orotate phosphoribosyltransferase [Candidatus Izemoplasmatales bacterium]
MKTKVAKALLDIEAVFLSPKKPFIWASGIKSPIYCDNRLTLSDPFTRDLIKISLAEAIKKNFEECEYIMGTATAGIAHAALVADLLGLPMGYVRTSSKTHGRKSKIEGKIIEKAKVVVIEDLISTGGSSIEVVKTLKESGFIVLGVVAIFSYELLKAKEAFKSIDVPYIAISDYDALKELAITKGYITKEEDEKLNLWKINPEDESWID